MLKTSRSARSTVEGPRAPRRGALAAAALLLAAALSACAATPDNADELDDLFTALPGVTGTSIDCHIREFMGDISDCTLFIVVDEEVSEDELQTVVTTAQESFDTLVVDAEVQWGDSDGEVRAGTCLQVKAGTTPEAVSRYLATAEVESVTSLCWRGAQLGASTDQGTDIEALATTTAEVVKVSKHGWVSVRTGSREITVTGRSMPTAALDVLARVDPSLLSYASIVDDRLLLTRAESITSEDFDAYIADLTDDDGTVEVTTLEPKSPKT